MLLLGASNNLSVSHHTLRLDRTTLRGHERTEELPSDILRGLSETFRLTAPLLKAIRAPTTVGQNLIFGHFLLLHTPDSVNSCVKKIQILGRKTSAASLPQTWMYRSHESWLYLQSWLIGLWNTTSVSEIKAAQFPKSDHKITNIDVILHSIFRPSVTIASLSSQRPNESEFPESGAESVHLATDSRQHLTQMVRELCAIFGRVNPCHSATSETFD